MSYHDNKFEKYFKETYKFKPELSPADRYELIKCPNCELIYQSFICDDESTKTLYSKFLTLDDNTVKSNDIKRMRSYQVEVDFIIKTFKKNFLNSSPNILDYGAGAGNWISFWEGKAVNVYAVDISEERIKYIMDNYPFTKYCSNEIPVSTKFDFINLDQVLEHISDPLSLLIKLRKSLNKNGIIKIYVPNSNNFNLEASSLIGKGPFQSLEHINSFTRRSLNYVCKLAGLKPVSKKILCRTLVGSKKVFRNVFQNNPNGFYTTIN